MSDLTPSIPWVSSLPRVSHLLVPVDFSPASLLSAGVAVKIARKHGARLTFLHVLTPVFQSPESVIHGPALHEERRAMALAELRAYQERLAEGLEASCELREGSPFEEIISFARSQPTDLIVLARVRQPGFLATFLGSTFERVVHEVPCAVLVLGGPENLWQEEPQHLLLTTDFSRASLAAIPWAESVARTYAARVTLTHVQAPMGLPGTREYAWHQEPIDELRQAADALLVSFRQRHLSPDLNIETRVIEGTPHRAINRLARRLRVSLIVISARGAKEWHQALTGCTTGRVVRHATCAVLIVPQPELPAEPA